MKRFKKIDLYFAAAYGYIFLPFLIFTLGWIKLFYAIPTVICVSIGLYRMFQSTPERERFEWNAKNKKRIIWIAVIILLWVAVSGIGGIAFQNEDHIWRNAMFETLVQEKWPVIKVVIKDGVRSTRGFSYYFGFWMVPALVGKLFGLQAGYYFQIIWAFVGVMLFYYGICLIRRKIEVWPLAVFVFYSGADILGYYLMGWNILKVPTTEHLEWWTLFQFSGITTQLFWVFNQAIPAWLITVLLYLQKNNRYIFFILSAALLNCTLPAVGLIPICIWWVFSRDYEAKRFCAQWWKSWLKDTVTVENVLCGGLIGILSALFLKRPTFADVGMFVDLTNGGWLVWLVFLAVEIGGICVAVYRYQKRNPLFYVMVVWLCLCPLPRVYGGENFCMRASIPALLILYIYVVEALVQSYHKKNRIHLAITLVVLAVGAVTPLHELTRTVSETAAIYNSEDENIRVESVGTAAVLSNSYESVNVWESVFYAGFAKY